MSADTKARVARAFHAMKGIGISDDKVKPVLKNLLKLYDKDWKLIEEENYRVLADAIFERDEAETAGNAKEIANSEAAESSKKVAINDIAGHSKEIPNREAAESSKKIAINGIAGNSKDIANSEKEDCLEDEAQATEEPEQPLKRLRRRYREGQTSTLNLSNTSVSKTPLLRPKDEPEELPETNTLKLNDSQDMVKSPYANGRKRLTSSKCTVISEGCDTSLPTNVDSIEQNTPSRTEEGVISPARLRDRGKGSWEMRPVRESSSDAVAVGGPNIKHAIVLQESIVSQDLVKPTDAPITDDKPYPEVPAAIHPAAQSVMACFGSVNVSAQSQIDPEVLLPNTSQLYPSNNGVNDGSQMNLTAVRHLQVDTEMIWPLHDVIDIAKGLEEVTVTLVNEVDDECLPSFCYIPQNVVFQNANLNFSTACIGEKNCCSTCFGDCLSLLVPCSCAHETGGEFAYTTDGLVKEELLDDCISMNRDPKKHSQIFCNECVLERSKNEDVIEPCKGHLVRKFIKECWSKCGCNKRCGNRVVQRGINRNLQVFMTPEGKGWGLRTLEDMPKGAFVCEYVGEVLTNAERLDRVSQHSRGGKHSYPILLDAIWGAEEVVKDEEALCLDTTYYGNVARFINHRCYDPNIVEIPVEVETPDHHYYHLALFTTRNVKTMEELTWDYGIEFDDHDQPTKAFDCLCGSKFCRNIKRPSRSRSSRR